MWGLYQLKGLQGELSRQQKRKASQKYSYLIWANNDRLSLMNRLIPDKWMQENFVCKIIVTSQKINHLSR